MMIKSGEDVGVSKYESDGIVGYDMSIDRRCLLCRRQNLVPEVYEDYKNLVFDTM